MVFLATPLRLNSLTADSVKQLFYPGEAEWISWRLSESFLAMYFQNHFRVKGPCALTDPASLFHVTPTGILPLFERVWCTLVHCTEASYVLAKAINNVHQTLPEDHTIAHQPRRGEAAMAPSHQLSMYCQQAHNYTACARVAASIRHKALM